MLNRLKSLRTNENVLIAIDALLHSKSSFLTTFLMTYMIRLSVNDSPADYIIYKLCSYACMAILSLVLLHFIKRFTLLSWRLGIFFAVVQVLVIMAFSGQTEIFPYILAFVTGLEATLYWRPQMFYSITEVRNDRRLRFQSIRQILTETIKIFMPIILGLLISDTGYGNAAYFILAISVVQLFLSVLFRPSREIRLAAHRPDVTFRKIAQNRSVRRVLYLQFFRGAIVSGSAFLVIAPLLAYKYLGSDSSLGLYASIGAGISIIFILIFRKISRDQERRQVFRAVAASLPALAAIALAIYPCEVTAIILYVSTVAVFEGFLNMFITSKVQSSLKKHLGQNSFTIEIESIGEVFLCTGRIVSLAILLFIIMTTGTTYLPHFAAINAIAIIPVILLSQGRKKTQIVEPTESI